jgi:hypothetical protein
MQLFINFIRVKGSLNETNVKVNKVVNILFG